MLWQSSRLLIGQWNHPIQLSDFEANLVVHRPAPPSQRFKATSPRLGRELHEQTKSGYKYNCIEEETGVTYWISGPKKRGGDRLYGGVVEIDEDARVEYWTKIRRLPESVELKQTL
jgi:hypothetical protein